MDWLSLIILIPIIGAVLLGTLGRTDNVDGRKRFMQLALAITIFNFLVSLSILGEFQIGQAGYQLEAIYSLGIASYHVGVDGISVWFVLLTTFLMPLIIIASWNVTHRIKEYIIAFLILESLVIGVFVVLDIVVFYIFFEAVLIPMFLIIGIWGGKNRVYASFKFFLYTLLGSVLMLVALIYMISIAGSSDFSQLAQAEYSTAPIRILGMTITGGAQSLLFLAFFASFAVKMPMWPVHTWLPDAHVQAPTAGSVILAAILLKMGGYGFLRFSLPMFPEASLLFQNFVFALSVIAIIYTSLVAMVQEDMKKLIAYSSVAHMGYVTMGIFTFNQQGVDGAIFQMLSHGLVSGALFLIVGVVYDRLHTREIAAFGGLIERMPVYALLFCFFTMANVGLPGTSGFVGEFLTLMGVFQVNSWVAALAALGMVLSAAYALSLYRRVMLGALIKENLKHIAAMDAREKLVFAPLVVGTILLGIAPFLIMDWISPSVEMLIANMNLPEFEVTSLSLEALEHGVDTANEAAH